MSRSKSMNSHETLWRQSRQENLFTNGQYENWGAICPTFNWDFWLDWDTGLWKLPIQWCLSSLPEKAIKKLGVRHKSWAQFTSTNWPQCALNLDRTCSGRGNDIMKCFSLEVGRVDGFDEVTARHGRHRVVDSQLQLPCAQLALRVKAGEPQPENKFKLLSWNNCSSVC